MERIRLPLKRHKIEQEGKGWRGREQKKVDLKRFVEMFVNQALKEMKEALGKFHSISEIVCRRELSVFFKQKAADFECLFLLISGVEYLKEANSNRHRMEKIKDVDGEYVMMADRLAHLFGSFKSMIVPKSDVFTSLQTVYNSSYLLPSLVGDSTEHEVASFEEINRITRMYLDKEDLSVYDSVVIDRGITVLSTRFFSFSLALCGEISRPEWKLINVRGDNEVFNRHLLFGMPHQIDKISRFLRVYEAHTKARDIFLMVKRSSERIELSIKGHYKRFEVSFHVFKMAVHVECSDINGKLFIEEDVFPSGKNVVESFESRVSEYLCRDGRNASFSFEKGFVALGDEEIQTFRSFTDLDVFLERKKENSSFYSFFEERFPCYRNHRTNMFGDRNVFIIENGLFVCIRLVRFVDSHMEIKVIVGSCELVDFPSYTEVIMEEDDRGEIVGIINGGKVKQSTIKTESLCKYFEKGMELLFLSYRLLPMINGKISVGEQILLNHRVKNTQIDIYIEKREEKFIVTTSRFGARTATTSGDVHNCVAFALLLMDIFTSSKDSELLNVISIDLFKGTTLRISGLPVSLKLDCSKSLKASPLAVNCGLRNSSILGALGLLYCFHGFFSNGLVPTASTPTSLIFVFRHLFKGHVKVKMVDRTKYMVSLNGGRIKDALGGFGREISSMDTSFPRKLSSFYFKEKIGLISDVARKSYKITASESEVSISTACGNFKIYIEDCRCKFQICSINTVEPSDQFIEAISEYFGEAMSEGRDIPSCIKLLDSSEELKRLFENIESKRKGNYSN
ncbi:uncharacterized protein Eint_080660 [Encephalitozoon intestinalis ATCC 50506]|uniref:Uncharacterized protein n=1 Tax=Encephalitozoon intestinalis (strain ATCC 50506) TaxID=876142 RepID=E0S8K6_ENCIT|nr:uncharacterized protein Eint_080660 [Encephalitozoon intestinalis ATCC 50506]ADM12000.1 hypothetical protein Eint_080660 [Encephalitozoon intestinalis ATCC 50506]UTX45788.1 hypothetical protein GPK93_08g13650 [Encephalitozoon intestinalis]